MKWVQIVEYLEFPLRCSCGKTADNAAQAFESHYKKGHILHPCPECGGKLHIPDVKGEYGCKDNTKYACYGCGREFDKDKVRQRKVNDDRSNNTFTLVDLPRRSWCVLPPRRWQVALTFAGVIVTAILWGVT